jgi:hypothetical protein
VELVRLDESGVSQAVVAEAPAGRGAAAKATETVARLADADADADDDDDDADDETRLLRGPVTTDAVVVRIARDRDSESGDENAHALAGLREKGWDAHTVAAASSYAVLAFIAIGYDEILPVYAKTREDLGGLRLSASQIGIVLIVGGVALIAFQLFVFPLVLKTFGVTKALRRASLAFAVVAFVAPVASVRGVVENPALKWFVVLFSQILKIVTLAVLFTTVIMAVNNSCMNRVKARVNGFATSCAAAGAYRVAHRARRRVFLRRCVYTKTFSSFSSSRLSRRARSRSSRSRRGCRADWTSRRGRRRTSARWARRGAKPRGRGVSNGIGSLEYY